MFVILKLYNPAKLLKIIVNIQLHIMVNMIVNLLLLLI